MASSDFAPYELPRLYDDAPRAESTVPLDLAHNRPPAEHLVPLTFTPATVRPPSLSVQPSPSGRPWRLALAALASVLALALIGGGARLAAARTPKHYVVLENSNNFPVALAIDGKPRDVFAAHATVRVELRAGAHEVSASGADAYTEKGSLTVTQRPTGFRGLYVIGAHSRMALVSRAYGAKGEDRFQPVKQGLRFIELPSGIDIEAIDQPFPDTVMADEGTPSVSVIHLCHAEPPWRSVGCWRK
jgi:hypothetical protein